MSIAKDTVNHPAYIRKLMEAGGKIAAEVAKSTGNDPGVDAGLFSYDEWKAGVSYEKGDLFLYNGAPGFVRQAHTSQAHYAPFSTGTEALYGARPKQGPDGVYSYVYNMRAEVGMRVRSSDGSIYLCKSAADPLLYDPKDVPALFDKETDVVV